MNHPYQTQAIQPAESDLFRIASLLGERVTRRSGISLVDFVPTIRVPTSAGPRAGQMFDLAWSPYARRPLELMDPSSQCQLVVLMFPTQTTKSLIGQWVTTYYSKELPTDVLYASCDGDTIENTMDSRIVPMLESVGVEFIAQTVNKKTRKTGDKQLFKQFSGGSLRGVTANSTGALAQATIRVLIGDELGKWKQKIGKEGSPWAQAWTRLKAWLDEKKGLAISSPADEETCLIYGLYLTGTQEEWHVECPLCGKPQVMDQVQHKDGYGLDYRTKHGNIIESSIVYVCQHCARSFKENKKFELQQTGIWIPKKDAVPINKYTNSFNVHSLNSMFESWREIAASYEKAKDDPIAMQDYMNLNAGQPHKQSGTRVKSEDVMKNRGEYPRQTVPDGVLYLTLGADVQRGGDRWQDLTEAELQLEIAKAHKDGDIHEKKFPRIEIEIYGPGPAYRGWSIDYQVFYGHVKDAYAGAFEQLYQWAVSIKEKNGGFGFKREKDGRFFPVVMALIDSGHEASTVYSFTQRLYFTYPSKGESVITPPKTKAGQDQHQSNFIFWKQSRLGSGIILYRISTKLYKKALYGFLSRERIEDDIQKPGFQEFPREYDTRYFDMLTAEERLNNGEYDAKGRPNEALDCRIYSMCASDIYINSQVEMFRQTYKKEGWSDKKLEQISSRWVIEYLATIAKIDKRFIEVKQK